MNKLEFIKEWTKTIIGANGGKVRLAVQRDDTQTVTIYFDIGLDKFVMEIRAWEPWRTADRPDLNN